ncbi:LLM class flavin-dependent oxidoreductase [Streptomyces sp. WI04-05B]|uniref:Luciferase-like monooxygenase n=1 Tax=Streptomyces turgidiscabies (strain Car8) TaxID=698760 RepID=L7F4P6_STRT8|nr:MULTISPECIES: LLM class flavin-dependent oxidoreductase [Streptomyces]ELP66573.1 luciferase-like monooxygenase [Streptomyces turgidiscabies Car8]MDX2541808.1 LLM class flavin-dependent oxidoreductase [Streptomyces sp. WI04-05B]MDX2586890.1 LLM class flavin-dependent oxidoreductase [Streptomyces sp. WI04-05A]MDX3496756.1 LLM class flavin-dependent oxidoreductase [Streptomyces turgidiscabies]GAQ74138.1 limonene 1,2-monooxygenase [Streptomyces turgidiscabies]
MHSRIGLFLSPVHETGQDPHLAIHRNLDLVELADRLNFDEAWFGEHHTLGWGLVGAPETLIAAASQRTRQIRLAHGVVPLSGHHPFHVASRAVHLHHLTRGRYILGVGPGVPFDATMFGLDGKEQRKRLDEALPTLLELVNGEERVTQKTDWYELVDAKLQLPRFGPGPIEVAVATSGTSVTSPRLIGRYGLSMTSFALPFALLTPGAPEHMGLAQQWKHAEEAADEYGQTLRREDWRVALPVHVAETREQAFAEVREGYDRWLFEYFGKAAGRAVLAPGASRETALEARVEAGGALVGSVDDVVEGVRRIQEATGGFGSLLVYVADWTSYENTNRSLELLARQVAPRINGAAARPQEAVDWAISRRSQ